MTDCDFPFCDGIRWLSVEDLTSINKTAIELTPGEIPGVKDLAKLESSQFAPANTRFYEQTEDIGHLAAVLTISLVTNHPFHNANKRTAFIAARVFMYVNGYTFDPCLEEAIEVMVEIAKGEDMDFRDAAMLSSWFFDNSRPIELDQDHIREADTFARYYAQRRSLDSRC